MAMISFLQSSDNAADFNARPYRRRWVEAERMVDRKKSVKWTRRTIIAQCYDSNNKDNRFYHRSRRLASSDCCNATRQTCLRWVPTWRETWTYACTFSQLHFHRRVMTSFNWAWLNHAAILEVHLMRTKGALKCGNLLFLCQLMLSADCVFRLWV